MEGIGITFFVRSPNYGFVKADASPRVQGAYSEFFWRETVSNFNFRCYSERVIGALSTYQSFGSSLIFGFGLDTWLRIQNFELSD